MSDEPTTTQEAPIADTPQNSESEVSIAPPEAVEAPSEGVIAESNKDTPPKIDEIRVETENKGISLENQGAVNPAAETVNSPVGTAQSGPVPEELKGQMAGNEPLTQNEPAKVEPLNIEPVQVEVKPIETQTPTTETNSQSSPQTEALPPSVAVPVAVQAPVNRFREFLNQAQQLIQTRKRKKLERIMNLFSKQSKIMNDEVEKLLHCSDATATRYLSQLEKEGKIKRNGKERGKYVSYSKI